MYTYFVSDIVTFFFSFGGAYLCLRCYLLTLSLTRSKWVGHFLNSGNNKRLKLEFETLKRLLD